MRQRATICSMAQIKLNLTVPDDETEKAIRERARAEHRSLAGFIAHAVRVYMSQCDDGNPDE